MIESTFLGSNIHGYVQNVALNDENYIAGFLCKIDFY